MAKSLYIYIYIYIGLAIQGRSVGKCYITMSHVIVTCPDVTQKWSYMTTIEK